MFFILHTMEKEMYFIDEFVHCIRANAHDNGIDNINCCYVRLITLNISLN